MKEHLIRIGGLALLLTAAVAVGMLGCSADSPTRPAAFERAGEIAALPSALLDDFDDIVLVLAGVEARRADGDDLDGWYGTAFEPADCAVSGLAGALCDLVNSIELPDGSYTQVRLLLGEGHRIVIAGAEYELIVGGGATGGVKLDLAFEITGGGDWNADLAIDPAGCVRVTGKGRYLMPPSLPVEVAAATGGAITGFVLPVEAQAEVWVDTPEGRISTFAAADTGEFLLAGVPAGTYVLYLAPTVVGPWEPVGIVGIEVVEGETLDLGNLTLGTP